jgi:hypothetical protein
MSNSDKNIIISPSIGSTDVKPSIQFTGAGNSTINLTVGDTNFIDFNSSDTSLFSVEHTSPNEDILVITNYAKRVQDFYPMDLLVLDFFLALLDMLV